MPMIEVTTTEDVSEKQAETIKRGLGSNIAIFNKPEVRVMVAIRGKAFMYFGGQPGPTAMISLSLVGEQTEKAYMDYAKKAVETLTTALPQIPKARIYVKYDTIVHKAWGGQF